jgi:hypothetical protein
MASPLLAAVVAVVLAAVASGAPAPMPMKFSPKIEEPFDGNKVAHGVRMVDGEFVLEPRQSKEESFGLGDIVFGYYTEAINQQGWWVGSLCVSVCVC